MAAFDEAVAKLEEVGLTEYEARCFVALSRVGDATATELGRMADVPRSRVYDTVDRLSQRGLVDVQESSPRRFRAAPLDAAFDRLRRDFETSLSDANAAVSKLETAKSPDESGTWSIADHEHVTDRLVELVDSAEMHVHLLIASDRVMDDRSLARLAAAADRGVTVAVETPTAAVRDRVEDAVPEAEVVVASELGETREVVNRWPGRLLLVDEHAVLASGVARDPLPGTIEEAAVWSHGRDHGFATWMRELLADRWAGDEAET